MSDGADVNGKTFTWNGGSVVILLVDIALSGFGHGAAIASFQGSSWFDVESSCCRSDACFTDMAKLAMEDVDVNQLVGFNCGNCNLSDRLDGHSQEKTGWTFDLTVKGVLAGSFVDDNVSSLVPD